TKQLTQQLKFNQDQQPTEIEAWNQTYRYYKILREYDQYRNLINRTYIPGMTQQPAYSVLWRYDKWGNPLYHRDPEGIETYSVYYNNDVGLKYVDYSGNQVQGFTEAFYQPQINPRIHSLKAGEATWLNGPGTLTVETYYNYNWQGDLTHIKRLLDGAWITEEMEYDQYGNLIRHTDPTGVMTEYEYNQTYGHAYMTKKIEYDGGNSYATTQYAYDQYGNLIMMVDPLGRVTQWQYDVLGRLTLQVNPDGTTRQAVYDDQARTLTLINERGAKVKKWYDRLGREYKTATFKNGQQYQVTLIEYNYVDKPALITDTAGRQTATEYDPLGRKTRQTYNDGTTRTWQYLDEENTVVMYDENSQPTITKYYWNGRVKARIIPLTEVQNLTLTYQYNWLGKTTKVKDTLQRETRFEYDQLGRLTKIVYPDGTLEQRTYDQAGRLTSYTDRNGQTTNYTYDGLGRLTVKTWPDGTQTWWQYDKTGRKTLAANPTATITITYDEMGRITWKNYTVDGQTYTFHYQYNPTGKPTRITYPDGTTIKITYDILDRPVQVKIVGKGIIANITYNLDNTPANTTLKNGVKIEYSYDPRGRLKTIHATHQGQTILLLNYTYDPEGNIVELQTQTHIETYSYDQADRLTEWTGPLGTWRYQYDLAGNRVELTTPEDTITYTYDQYDRLTRIQKENSGETWTLTYDQAGQLTGKTNGTLTYSYAYNPAGQLVKAWLNGQLIAEYWYGPEGSRIKAWENGVETISLQEYRLQGQTRTLEVLGFARLVNQSLRFLVRDLQGSVRL
ncbi:MAG: hypothetical protein DRN81_06910, partial [Thermoproteota archaeon]